MLSDGLGIAIWIKALVATQLPDNKLFSRPSENVAFVRDHAGYAARKSEETSDGRIVPFQCV